MLLLDDCKKNRSKTHLAEVTDVSAEFLLQSFRVIGAATGHQDWPAHDKGPDKAKKKRRGKKRCRHNTGGGGVQRVCVSDALRERPHLDRRLVFRLAHQRLRQARAEQGAAWQSLLERGRRLTLLHKAGVELPKRKRARNDGVNVGPLKVAKDVMLMPVQTCLPPLHVGGADVSDQNIVHNEGIHCAAALTESCVAKHKEQVKEERDAVAKMRESLHSFSTRLEGAQRCRVLPGLPRVIRPQGALEKSLSLQSQQLVPPVPRYLRAGLECRKADMHGDLANLWSLKHIPFRHQEADSSRSHQHRPLTDVTLCMRAGFCCCGKPHFTSFAAKVINFVRKLSAKNAATKALMDSHKAVLLLESQGRKHFFHIAYVNKKHNHYVLFALQPVDKPEEWGGRPQGSILLTRSSTQSRKTRCVVSFPVQSPRQSLTERGFGSTFVCISCPS